MSVYKISGVTRYIFIPTVAVICLIFLQFLKAFINKIYLQNAQIVCTLSPYKYYSYTLSKLRNK